MMTGKSFIETQFPIGPLSLESYKERDAKGAKILSSLGKWWGAKPMVLVRAIVIGTVMPASETPEQWPDDLEVFLRCMCLDNAGMWKRKNKRLPAALCYPMATEEERAELFTEEGKKWRIRGVREKRLELEKRVFYSMNHTEQREYCLRVEEIDGPPEESWRVINAYLSTSATTLAELVQELAQRRFGSRLKVGDAFCGIGSIPFEAAELGCDVYASDLNPVACLLTWGALNLIGGSDAFRREVHQAQEHIYEQVDQWIVENGLETSEEGWRAEAYLYCLEIKAPEWDDWRVPICPNWIVAPKFEVWAELVPIENEKRFGFRIRYGGAGYADAKKGTKQGREIVCPQPLWEIFKRDGKHKSMPRTLPYQRLIENGGGLRKWEKRDVVPRADDLLQERLYCIRWRKPDWVDERGKNRKGELVYREPRSHDLDVEAKTLKMLDEVFDEWQSNGWIPNWRIEPGKETARLKREKGWTYWHHLFHPRQLLFIGFYSKILIEFNKNKLAALTLTLGILINYSSRICHWLGSQGGGIGGTKWTFYNQALNTFPNFPVRSWSGLSKNAIYTHKNYLTNVNKQVSLCSAQELNEKCNLWITDPPYADAVNYEELSEFFLAWYAPHIKSAFPDWYTDSMRTKAVKGNDAPFRIAMTECYRRLAENMPDNGMQVVMFTSKSTDVWEDLALIMWAAGLQIKQVWSVATETPGTGIRTGNYVQATYNMVLKKRTGNKMGFKDLIIPALNKRVKQEIARMRESQIQGGLSRCGYTDTDFLLAAQAIAAEVVTGYATIEGMELDAELRTPNKERGRSALRSLMENAKRTATDFLVPLLLEQALVNKGDKGTDPYQFWRAFSPEEKFLLKGLELEYQGENKLSAFQDLGRAYGIPDYEALLGPARANNARTKTPKEFPRPDLTRFDEVPHSDRDLWKHSPTRQLYHGLKLLNEGADVERAIKHIVDTTDFWNIRTSRLLVLLGYLKEVTAYLKHWKPFADSIMTLAIGIEHYRN